MAKRGIEPDTYTTCALLKLQARLLDARGVWRWARKRDAAYGRVAWNHLIESHLRLGQPYRVSALLSLMEGRDRINAGGKTSAHNLYLRSLIASGRPSRRFRILSGWLLRSRCSRSIWMSSSRWHGDGRDG